MDRPDADVPGPVPSTSGFISPFVISPPPKMTRTNSSKRKSDRSKSEHLTSSPYKKRLHEVTGEKLQREADKVNRAKARAEKKLQKEKKSKAAEMSKKQKGKGKSKGKRLRIATPEPESGESGEDETCCLFCCEAYSMSANEGWIQCTQCVDDGHMMIVLVLAMMMTILFVIYVRRPNHISRGHHHSISWLPYLR